MLSDNEKAFFHYFLLDLISFDKREEILAMSDVWGVEVEENSFEELPFEDFNNMTFGYRLKVLRERSVLEILRNKGLA